MLTDKFPPIEWKNGAIENPTYFTASNLNSINKDTKAAFDELENRLIGYTGDNPSRPILSIYKSLNLFPDDKNNNAVNPKGRKEGSLIGASSIGFGFNNVASSSNSIAIGSEAKALGENSIALGQVTAAEGIGSICIGKSNLPSNNFSVNIGYLESNTTEEKAGDSSISIGKNAKALANNAIQLGEGVNNIENSLQIGQQNIFLIKTSTNTNGDAQVVNTFGSEPSEKVRNEFLGSAESVSKQLGEGEDIRDIKDVFETASPVVKCSTNTLNGIPVGEGETDSFKKIYYNELQNKLHTNISVGGNSKEEIARTFLIYKNSASAQYNAINKERLPLTALDDDDESHVHTDDILKIVVRDDSPLVNVSGQEKEIFLNIEGISGQYSYSTSYVATYFNPTDNSFIFKECHLVYDTTGVYFSSGGILQLSNASITVAPLSNSDDFPIIQRIYKLL